MSPGPGHRTVGAGGVTTNPTAMLGTLLGKREKLQSELRKVERQVYDLETSYLQDTGHFGNALKGFEGFLPSSRGNSNLKRPKKFQLEDRIFSLSSVTSPAADELGNGRDDGTSDFGPNRSKGGSFPANGQGRPKKGRTPIGIGTRDAKRIRQSSEPDLGEDDPDTSLT